MRAAKVQASLCIHAVSPEPPLLAHTSSESRGTFKQKARSLATLNGWACAVKICHDGMLEDTNSLDAAHLIPRTCIKPNITIVTVANCRMQISVCYHRNQQRFDIRIFFKQLIFISAYNAFATIVTTQVSNIWFSYWEDYIYGTENISPNETIVTTVPNIGHIQIFMISITV